MIIRRIAAAGISVALVSALSACGGGNADQGNPKPVDDASEQAIDAKTDDAPATSGTRDNPAKPGETFTIGDYEITFGETVTGEKALDLLEYPEWLEEEGSDPPVILPIKLTYLGSEDGEGTGTPWIDLIDKLLLPDGNTVSDYCNGGLKDAVTDVSEMFEGASAEANVCRPVPEDTDLDGALWIIEESFAVGDSARTFVAFTK